MTARDLFDDEDRCEVPTCSGRRTHTISGQRVTLLVCRAHGDRIKAKAPHARLKAL